MRAIYRLAPFILFLLSLQSANAQTTLSIPFRRRISLSPKSSPRVLKLPASEDAYSLSIAICGAVLPLPRFFVSDETGVTLPGPTDAQGSQGGDELDLDEGLLTYNTTTPNGSTLAIWPSTGAGANWTFDVAVSGEGERNFLDGALKPDEHLLSYRTVASKNNGASASWRHYIYSSPLVFAAIPPSGVRRTDLPKLHSSACHSYDSHPSIFAPCTQQYSSSVPHRRRQRNCLAYKLRLCSLNQTRRRDHKYCVTHSPP